MNDLHVEHGCLSPKKCQNEKYFLPPQRVPHLQNSVEAYLLFIRSTLLWSILSPSLKLTLILIHKDRSRDEQQRLKSSHSFSNYPHLRHSYVSRWVLIGPESDNWLPLSFQLPKVIIWGLSLYIALSVIGLIRQSRENLKLGLVKILKFKFSWDADVWLRFWSRCME